MLPTEQRQSLKITCGQCGAALHVPEARPGKKLQCPRCGCRFVLPALAAHEPADPDEAGLAAPAAQAAPNQGQQTRVLVGGAVAGLVVILGVIVIFYAVHSGSPTKPPRSGGGQPAGRREIDAALPSPDQASGPASPVEAARLYVRQHFGGALDRSAIQSATGDNVQLARRLIAEADRLKPDQPLASAVLFAHAAQLLVDVGGHYREANDAINNSIAAIWAADPSLDGRVSELSQAEAALDRSPEAKTQPDRESHRPSFFERR